MPNHSKPQLGAIRAVTFSVPDIEAATEAYVSALGYRVLADTVIDTATATRWRAPALAGRAMRTLGPTSGEPVVLRFVAAPGTAPVPALTSHGWNATEIVVQDVDALAARLTAHPAFTIIGPPMGLTRFPMIRAMQAIGPFDECLYFTEVGPGSGLDLAPALSPVGRVFIVVAGGGDLAAMFAAYADFGNVIDPPVATPVRVISAANGLPADTLHPHGLIKLREGTMIELDGYPECTGPRPAVPGELPPGMAMVSFACPVAPGGERLLVGAAGERIELLEGEE
ncbi:VOC family protein [Polymorphobacter sp.]|uniref:VOC family protein n=1 Tax=Polymorphobacter sp. TaxID=1909290 RepID=UPI003F7259BA